MTSNPQSELTLPFTLIAERRSRNVLIPTVFPSGGEDPPPGRVTVAFASVSSVRYHAWSRRPSLTSPLSPNLSAVGSEGAVAGFGAGLSYPGRSCLRL